MRYLSLLAISLSLFLFSGCKEENNPVTPPSTFTAPAISLGEVYVSGTKVNVYSYDSLKVGYRKLYFRVTDSTSGATLTGTPVTFMPMMQMMTMAHTTPFWQADSLPVNGYYSGGLVFIMPGSDMEYWYLNVTVDNKNKGRKETQQVRLKVGSSSEAFVLTGNDSGKYVVCMHPLNKPAVGLNDITFSLNKRASMMSFPEVTDCSIEMTPDMPSMGHGSPNNVNPVYTGSAKYSGKVNFTMTGEWRITVKVKKGSAELFTKEFFITL